MLLLCSSIALRCIFYSSVLAVLPAPARAEVPYCCRDCRGSYSDGVCAGSPALLPESVFGLFCGRVVPGSSRVPSAGSVIESRLFSAPPCLHVVPEFSEVPSVDLDPKRLPATWTALLVRGSRILEGLLRGHVTPTHSVSCLPPRSVLHVALLGFCWGLPGGSLLDRACLLDDGFARVCGVLALTRPAGRARPRHSQHRASVGCLQQPPNPR